jgi:hypothetical protein
MLLGLRECRWRHFDEKIAKRDWQAIAKRPGPTARLLRDLLVGTGAVGGVVLDVGSGVGGLSFELLDREPSA